MQNLTNEISKAQTSLEERIHILKTSSQLGDPATQLELGDLLFADGRPEEAAQYYYAASNQESAMAARNLAMKIINTWERPYFKNQKKLLLKKAAEQGLLLAQKEFADFLYEDTIVSPFKEAFPWYFKAATNKDLGEGEAAEASLEAQQYAKTMLLQKTGCDPDKLINFINEIDQLFCGDISTDVQVIIEKFKDTIFEKLAGSNSLNKFSIGTSQEDLKKLKNMIYLIRSLDQILTNPSLPISSPDFADLQAQASKLRRAVLDSVLSSKFNFAKKSFQQANVELGELQIKFRSLQEPQTTIISTEASGDISDDDTDDRKQEENFNPAPSAPPKEQENFYQAPSTPLKLLDGLDNKEEKENENIPITGEEAFRKGESFYTIGHYRSSMGLFLEAARKGHPLANLYLGVMYQVELFGKENKTNAIEHFKQVDFKWLTEEISKNNPDAIYALGLYCSVLGTESALKHAIKCFEVADKLGHAAASYHLGYYHLRGIGVPANSALAIKLFEKAASQKYPPALNALGYYYYNYQYSSHKHQSFFRDKAITGYIALHTNLKWCHGRHVDNNYVLLDPSSYFMGIWCNDANAQFNLARFLLDQIGPRYDIPQQERGEKSAQIMRLLLLASRNGHLSAQQHLQIIHNNIKNLLSLNKPLNQDQLCSLGFLLAEGRQQLATTWSNLPFWKPEWKNEAPTHQQLSLMLEEWYQKNREIMGLPENDQNLSKESIYLYFMDRHWDILSVEEDQQTRLLKKSVSWGEQVQSIEHKKYLAERCKQLRLQDAQGYWNRQVSSQLSLGGVEESKVEELAQEDAGLQQTLVWLQQQALILTEPSAPSEPFFDAPPAYHQIAEKEIPDFIDTAPQDEKVDNNEAAAASLLTPLSFSHESKSSSFEEELSQLTLELSQLNDLNTELTQKNAHLEQENAHLKEENRQLKNSQNEERVFSSVESRNDEAGNISAMLQQMLEGQRRQEAQTNQVNINLSEQNAKLQQMVLDLQRQIAAISVGQQGQQQISNSAEPGAGATSAFFK